MNGDLSTKKSLKPCISKFGTKPMLLIALLIQTTLLWTLSFFNPYLNVNPPLKTHCHASLYSTTYSLSQRSRRIPMLTYTSLVLLWMSWAFGVLLDHKMSQNLITFSSLSLVEHINLCNNNFSSMEYICNGWVVAIAPQSKRIATPNIWFSVAYTIHNHSTIIVLHSQTNN